MYGDFFVTDHVGLLEFSIIRTQRTLIDPEDNVA